VTRELDILITIYVQCNMHPIIYKFFFSILHLLRLDNKISSKVHEGLRKDYVQNKRSFELRKWYKFVSHNVIDRIMSYEILAYSNE